MENSIDLEKLKNGEMSEEEIHSFHPVILAKHLHEIPIDLVTRIISNLDSSFAAKVLVETHESTCESILSLTPIKKIVTWVSILPSDESAYLINLLDDVKRGEILNFLSHEDRGEVEEILKFSEDQVGSIMQIETIKVEWQQTVKEALSYIRKHLDNEQIKNYHKAYVLDEEGYLKGEIPLTTFLICSPSDLVANIAEPIGVKLLPTMNSEEAAQLTLKHNEHSVPVVNKENRLIGRVTLDDLGEVLQEEFAEDIGKMAGTGDEQVVESLGKAVQERLPWLLLGLIGGLLLAYLLGMFESDLKKFPEFIFFVPLIMSMGGSVGIQSSSIMVRGLSTGDIKLSDWFPRIMRELRISIINGSICSLCIVFFSTIFLDHHFFGVLVSICLFIVMLCAAIIGVIVPLTLKFCKIEPAYSTGPFITIGNDMLGIAIYMSVGRLFLGYLS